MDWISTNAQAIGTVTNVIMLIVWTVYLHVFLGQRRRQERPRILINRGGGRGIDGHCLVSNMSAEPIYLVSVAVRLAGPDREWGKTVSDVPETDERNGLSDLRIATRQGPLLSGHVRDVGTFRELADNVLREQATDGTDGLSLDDISRMEVAVVAIYASEDLPCGAQRRYLVEGDDEGARLTPESPDTDQIRSPRKRRRLVSMLAEG